MGTPTLSDELCREAVEAFREAGTKQGAARLLGIPRQTFQHRLYTAAQRGMMGTAPILPGFRLSKTTTVTNANGEVIREFIQQKPDNDGHFEVPAGHIVKGVSAYLDGRGGVVGQWIKTRAEPDPIAIVDALKAAFENYAPEAPYIAAPGNCDGELLTLYPLADLHIGSFSWGRETETDWDLKTAIEAYRVTMQRVHMASPPSQIAIVLGGGDLLHTDTSRNQTAHSGNPLDVDTRFAKLLEEAGKLLVYQVDLALSKHETVIVRILPGNHDEHSALAVTYFLLAWYRNEPRAIIDNDPSLFFWHEFGKVLIGATHGHTVKVKDLPMIMAARQSEAWGRTAYRFFHGFHVHHKTQHIFEGGGIIAETHQSPAAQDAWHHGNGYISGRSMQSITYHKQHGEVSRNKVSMI